MLCASVPTLIRSPAGSLETQAGGALTTQSGHCCYLHRCLYASGYLDHRIQVITARVDCGDDCIPLLLFSRGARPVPAPMLSSMRGICVVPGLGTIRGLLPTSHASANRAVENCFRVPQVSANHVVCTEVTQRDLRNFLPVESASATFWQSPPVASDRA